MLLRQLLVAALASLAFSSNLPSVSHVRVPEDTFEPVQIRSAYAGPTGMIVSWNTFSKLPSPPTVQFGFAPNSLPFTSSPKNGQSVTYPTSLTFNVASTITFVSQTCSQTPSIFGDPHFRIRPASSLSPPRERRVIILHLSLLSLWIWV